MGMKPVRVVRAVRETVKDRFTVAQRVHTLDGRRPFRTLPVALRDKYFTSLEEGFRLDDEIGARGQGRGTQP